MASLETQYKDFKTKNPDSTFTFDQWLEWHSKKLSETIKQINL